MAKMVYSSRHPFHVSFVLDHIEHDRETTAQRGFRLGFIQDSTNC